MTDAEIRLCADLWPMIPFIQLHLDVASMYTVEDKLISCSEAQPFINNESNSQLGPAKSEFERIPNFRTNRVPNMYSKIKSVRIEYRVITHSGKTIRIVFEYQKLFE